MESFSLLFFFFALWRSSGGELRAVSCVFEAGVVRGLILPAVPQSTAVYQINRAARDKKKNTRTKALKTPDAHQEIRIQARKCPPCLALKQKTIILAFVCFVYHLCFPDSHTHTNTHLTATRSLSDSLSR